MKRMLVLSVLLLSMCQIVWASAKEQDYTASKQAVFNAAVRVIQKDWNITFMDRETGIISFKTGTSLRSNGMECQVSVIEVSASQTKLRVGAQKTGGQLVAWGAGGSIASKVFKGVEDELKSSTPRCFDAERSSSCADTACLQSPCSRSYRIKAVGLISRTIGKAGCFAAKLPRSRRDAPCFSRVDTTCITYDKASGFPTRSCCANATELSCNDPTRAFSCAKTNCFQYGSRTGYGRVLVKPSRGCH